MMIDDGLCTVVYKNLEKDSGRAQYKKSVNEDNDNLIFYFHTAKHLIMSFCDQHLIH